MRDGAGMLCRIGRDTAVEASPMSANTQGRKLLTNADAFRDVSRGNPKPFTLKGEELVKARLTPSTWRLEILAAGSTKLQRPRRLEDNTAINLPMLEDLGKRHGVKFLKAMQCLNIASAAWPGTVGRRAVARGIETRRQNSQRSPHLTSGVSTITIPNSSFSRRSAIARSWRRRREILPVFVAYRLNGQPISPAARRAGADGRAVGARVQIDQVAAAHHADQRLQGQRHLRRRRQRSRIAPENDGSHRRRPGVVRGRSADNADGHGDGRRSGLRRVEYWLRPDAGTARPDRRRTIPPGKRPSGSRARSIRRPRTGPASCPRTCSRARSGASTHARAGRRNGRYATASCRGRWR